MNEIQWVLCPICGNKTRGYAELWKQYSELLKHIAKLVTL